MPDPMTVLVTGASGFVGAEVTARLTAAGHTVLTLLHRTGDLVRNNGRKLTPGPGTLTAVTGDITRPGLGLTDEARGIVAGADRIVHCAAVTDFGLPYARYERVNVAGTRNVLDIALAHRTPLVHVSTAYVCGERDGTAREDELDVGQHPGNGYEKSKLTAETTVRKAAADGLPVAVVRPSTVTGASRTGRARDRKTVYPVLRVLTRGLVRTVPGHYDALLDLVPVDHVADMVAEATTRFEDAEGRTLHAVGHELTLRDFSEVLAEYPSFRVPRFVPPSAFSASALPARERPYHDRVIALYETYFRRRVHFDVTQAAAFAGRPAATGARPYLRRLLDDCLATGYLGPAQGPEQTATRPDGSTHR
ncbi:MULTISPECIES: SDR family oxidoreductase [unclassified Streptomyces]|uniref:SDR family oxidoreductase n=1 Tax=unclassified Streptomyces TaxID=2593676 RepID=UPI001F047747|nr:MULTISPECIES: SDR family oxidoreductase [unclassified Streptomyces]MCH0566497.1 SDR family oxidoreductase [Streptomyces sp. MUM 2J]MCH0571915.1 SDR family oxidoreductase [Streptomyces sp. MUM 136J]